MHRALGHRDRLQSGAEAEAVGDGGAEVGQVGAPAWSRWPAIAATCSCHAKAPASSPGIGPRGLSHADSEPTAVPMTARTLAAMRSSTSRRVSRVAAVSYTHLTLPTIY